MHAPGSQSLCRESANLMAYVIETLEFYWADEHSSLHAWGEALSFLRVHPCRLWAECFVDVTSVINSVNHSFEVIHVCVTSRTVPVLLIPLPAPLGRCPASPVNTCPCAQFSPWSEDGTQELDVAPVE